MTLKSTFYRDVMPVVLWSLLELCVIRVLKCILMTAGRKILLDENTFENRLKSEIG
jgi:hypothetical protein